VTSLISRVHRSLPAVSPANRPLCATRGCSSLADAEGRCVRCLAAQVRHYRREAHVWRQRFGVLLGASRRLVDVLGRDADGDVDGGWLDRLRVAHTQVESVVYPDRRA
jgi:hypothetical protein